MPFAKHPLTVASSSDPALGRDLDSRDGNIGVGVRKVHLIEHGSRPVLNLPETATLIGLFAR